MISDGSSRHHQRQHQSDERDEGQRFEIRQQPDGRQRIQIDSSLVMPARRWSMRGRSSIAGTVRQRSDEGDAVEGAQEPKRAPATYARTNRDQTHNIPFALAADNKCLACVHKQLRASAWYKTIAKV